MREFFEFFLEFGYVFKPDLRGYWYALSEVFDREFSNVILSHFFNGEIEFEAFLIEELDFFESFFNFSLDAIEGRLGLLERGIDIHGV